MAGRLSSKAVTVTGGSTGIGEAVASRVVAEGVSSRREWAGRPR
jgi:NAD(P)-dependent dehydrogenase (short-subunit alcohol dehydrogenase family)